ncbi:hypothetical protein ACFY9F_35850 [Streptomyces sp. NPDC012421]|uniref:hypothetical protein n=1 Tax=Streptomyces sp. NPDC012421 TaxID=3364832 RepID=UPI0036E2A12A
MDETEEKWQSWLSGLDPSKRAAATWLRTQFEALGWAPIGRRLSGLREDLLTMDPSGRDGADLWR